MPIQKIDALYNSHPHHDHLGGFDALTDRYQLGAVYICFHEYYTDTMQAMVKAAKKKNIEIRHFDDGDTFAIGDATLVCWMKSDPDWDVNNQSSIMKLTFGERSILFTADAPEREMARYASVLTNGELKSDIIKFPHHGLTPLQRAFGDAVSPIFSILTGYNNERTEKSVYDIKLRGAYSYSTTAGSLHLVTDGSVWYAERIISSTFVPSEVTPLPTITPAPTPTYWPFKLLEELQN